MFRFGGRGFYLRGRESSLPCRGVRLMLLSRTRAYTQFCFASVASENLLIGLIIRCLTAEASGGKTKERSGKCLKIIELMRFLASAALKRADFAEECGSKRKQKGDICFHRGMLIFR